MNRGVFTVTEGALQWLTGLPEGSRIIDIQWNHPRSIATMVVDHPGIPETPDGELKPLSPSITIAEDGSRLWAWELPQEGIKGDEEVTDADYEAVE